MIAIDPGSAQSAAVVVTDGKLIESVLIPNKDMLSFIRTYSSHPLAIEMIASYGMSVGEEVFSTCVWIGRFVEAHRGQRRFVKRMEVKMHLCHDSKANDSAIRKALIDRFGPPGTKKAPGTLYGVTKDKLAALGVALTALETRGAWSTG